MTGGKEVDSQKSTLRVVRADLLEKSHYGKKAKHLQLILLVWFDAVQKHFSYCSVHVHAGHVPQPAPPAVSHVRILTGDAWASSAILPVIILASILDFRFSDFVLHCRELLAS